MRSSKSHAINRKQIAHARSFVGLGKSLLTVIGFPRQPGGPGRRAGPTISLKESTFTAAVVGDANFAISLVVSD
jgi:hypothetical protein